MPTRTYMVVDARRDHAIRVPRPDLSVALGTPNACNNCHADRTAQWAAERIAEWFGPGRRAEAHYGSVIEAGRKGEPGADAALAALILDSGKPSIVRATALSLLPTFAADIGTEEIRSYLAGISDADPLVRVAAVEALAPFAPEERAQVAAPLLSDKVLAVRIAAARALAAVPPASLSPEQRAAFDAAGAELIAAEKASAERPEAWLSIGAFEAERGRPAEAEAAYRQALRLDPDIGAGDGQSRRSLSRHRARQRSRAAAAPGDRGRAGLCAGRARPRPPARAPPGHAGRLGSIAKGGRAGAGGCALCLCLCNRPQFRGPVAGRAWRS